MHGAVNEKGIFVQKGTGFGSNIRWKKTTLRCSGHNGVGHAHLQGQVNGINRTAMSAVYPKRMCHKMCTTGSRNRNQRFQRERMIALQDATRHSRTKIIYNHDIGISATRYRWPQWSWKAKRTYWMGNYEGDRSEYLYGQDNDRRVKKLEKRYEAIPEEYYKHTGHRLRWHAWEICSGSGRLSLVMIMAGLLIGFPVDLRYGWDINGDLSLRGKMISGGLCAIYLYYYQATATEEEPSSTSPAPRAPDMQKEDFTMAYHQQDKMRRIYMGDFPESWKAEAQVVTTYIKELRQVNYEEMREAEIFRVDVEADNIEGSDLYNIWPQVEAADLAEIRQFVEEKAFRKIHVDSLTSETIVVDSRWVRKWKRMLDRTTKVKSRLCARGFMDSQKSMLATRSTTATRLSQRLLVSTSARTGYSLESWDIAGAFLKGLSFQKVKELLQRRGITTPERKVVVMAPANVWRHLASIDSFFAIPENKLEDYGLLCGNPSTVCGLSSSLDENIVWKNENGLTAMATTHVDDLAVTADQKWLNKYYDLFVQRFKKVSRNAMPFEHCGCEYNTTPSGSVITQKEFSKKIPLAAVPNRVNKVIKQAQGPNNVNLGLQYRKFNTMHQRIIAVHAKRISYSTSHSETLAAVSAMEVATLVRLRLSEINFPKVMPTVKELIAIQEKGDINMSIDIYTDCKEYYELTTRSMLPQDRTQRLYILSIRKSRYLPTSKDSTEEDLYKGDRTITEKIAYGTLALLTARVSDSFFIYGIILVSMATALLLEGLITMIHKWYRDYARCSTRVVLLVSEICQPFESASEEEGEGQSFTTRLSLKIQELNSEIEKHQKTKDQLDAAKKKACAAEEYIQAQKLKDQSRKNEKELSRLEGEQSRLLQQRDGVCLRVLAIVSALLRWANSDLRKDPALMGTLHQILLPMVSLPALSKEVEVCVVYAICLFSVRDGEVAKSHWRQPGLPIGYT
ncbi:unnamed protein product [Effrenium voratum]|nr:unnamed protein product [Effrenium voratum]